MLNKKRLSSIAIIFISTLSLLSVRLYFLQAHPSERVAGDLQSNQQEKITDSSFRVLDINGKDLLKYNKKYVIVIDKKPFSLNNYEESLEGLMALNFIMKGEIEDFNYTDVMKSDGKLYYTVSEETYNKVKNLKNIKGIYNYIVDETDTKEAWSISNLLFAIKDKKKEELVDNSLQEKIYEQIQNNSLPSRKFYLDDKALYGKNEVNVDEGNKDLKLTIDKEIQENISEIINREDFSNLDNIGVILMESDTGEIKALVQKDESNANINLAIEGMGYEPGSIFKLITLGAALDKGVITMQDKFTCNESICTLGNHGTQTVKEALINSCNDAFAKIGNKVGYKDIMEYAKKSGVFSNVLGIKGEGCNETEGKAPSIEAGLNNISIGQCMTVSPIQMLGAINAIVNNGIYVKPYILDSYVDKNGNVIEKIETDSKKIYSKTTSGLIKEAMKEVIEKGTGYRAKVQGIEMGGKTGSATSSSGNTHGWFVGYYVYKDKTYTMIIFVPDIKGKGKDGEDMGGGNTAAPIFKEIVKSIIEQ